MASPIPIPAGRPHHHRTPTQDSDFSTSPSPARYPSEEQWPASSSLPPAAGSVSRATTATTIVDSGYGSATTTALVSPKTSGVAPAAPLAHSKVKSVPLPGRDGLSIFRADVGPEHHARFRAILPEMQRLLTKHAASLVCKSRGGSFFGKAKPARGAMTMSMRLLMVGEDEAGARPAIVVFVAGEETAGLERLMEQPVMRSLYRPDDGFTPEFRVVVVGQAPRKRYGREVNVLWESWMRGERDPATYCGTRIVLEEGEGRAATGTMGGMVKVVYGNGECELLGMTAGHVLEGLWYGQEEDEGDLREKNARFKPLRSMGSLVCPRESDGCIPKHDWALFELDDGLKVKPNMMQQAGGTHPAARVTRSSLSRRVPSTNILTTAPPESFPEEQPIEVSILGGGSSSNHARDMLGLLSHMPGGIMLDPEQGFVDAYLVVLDEGLAFQDGDSGSWITNPVNMEVYGHVVADDLTGDAYVVPLHACFTEMKERLSAELVDLPTSADFLNAALWATTTRAGNPQLRSRRQQPELRDTATLTARDCSRDRRLSDVLSLCEGLRLRTVTRDGKGHRLFHDSDSGYGSLGSPRVCWSMMATKMTRVGSGD